LADGATREWSACRILGAVRVGNDDHGMAQNFLACDRDQALLLPASLREWLPEDHLAWFVIDAVAQFDLVRVLLRLSR
jgi:hypothetical protein